MYCKSVKLYPSEVCVCMHTSLYVYACGVCKYVCARAVVSVHLAHTLLYAAIYIIV